MGNYVVVLCYRGLTEEVNLAKNITEARNKFKEIAKRKGYKPSEINSSADYHLSMWEWDSAQSRYSFLEF